MYIILNKRTLLPCGGKVLAKSPLKTSIPTFQTEAGATLWMEKEITFRKSFFLGVEPEGYRVEKFSKEAAEKLLFSSHMDVSFEDDKIIVTGNWEVLGPLSCVNFSELEEENSENEDTEETTVEKIK